MATKAEVMQALLDAMHKQSVTPSSIGGSNAQAVKTFAEAYQLLDNTSDRDLG